MIELWKVYGNVWKFTLPGMKGVFIAEPDLVQEIMANPDKFPKVDFGDWHAQSSDNLK